MDTATVNTTPVNATADGVRNFAGGIGYGAGKYETVVCISDNIGGTATAAPTNVPAATCTSGTAIK